jgi:broad specificity phosphatase PhoE
MGDWIDLQSDPQLIDTPLSPEGEKQCHEAAHRIQDIPFDVVFISPLTRCLQTALLIFKDNVNYNNMHFIIHPGLREKLHVSADLLSTYDLN